MAGCEIFVSAIKGLVNYPLYCSLSPAPHSAPPMITIPGQWVKLLA